MLGNALIYVVAFSACALARIINVPDDYPTIGGGIAAADHGDMVLVQPGFYAEHIAFEGEGITVASMFIYTGDYSDIYSTIIDGGGMGATVNFRVTWPYSYYRDIIIGFTIQNGLVGIDCFHDTTPLISFNAISGNSLGIVTEMSDVTIIHNLITGNSGNEGAGICLGCFSEAEIYNNVIAGNSAVKGGGIFLGCEPGFEFMIDNNTIFGNTAEEYGGGIFCADGQTTILNTILWGDSAGIAGNEIYVEGGSVWAEFCDIEGGWGGNMDAEPLFRDPENGDFHLMWTECGDPYDSPCIDVGDWFETVLNCDWGLGDVLTDLGAFGGRHIDLPTVVSEDNDAIVPISIRLIQNHPNPFNARTIIQYSLPSSSEISISVYDMLGRQISTIFEGLRDSGDHTILWDARDLPSGIYLACLQAGSHNSTVKMVLTK